MWSLLQPKMVLCKCIPKKPPLWCKGFHMCRDIPFWYCPRQIWQHQFPFLPLQSSCNIFYAMVKEWDRAIKCWLCLKHNFFELLFLVRLPSIVSCIISFLDCFPFSFYTSVLVLLFYFVLSLLFCFLDFLGFLFLLYPPPPPYSAQILSWQGRCYSRQLNLDQTWPSN